MGGRGWRAELDFDVQEPVAYLVQPIEGTSSSVLVATVPLGDFTPETKDWYAALKPNDEQNKRLMMLVFAPDAWRMLAGIRDQLAARRPCEDDCPHPGYLHEREDAGLLDEINRVLEYRAVPKDEAEIGDVE